MDSCCNDKEAEMRELAKRQKKVLWTVMFINITMFFCEGIYGIIAASTSLLADSLDMLGDAMVYGFSIFSIGHSVKREAAVSILKGAIMTIFGIGVAAEAIRRFLAPGLPEPFTMGVIGSLAMVANFICAALLLRHRNESLNMRSTWLCSRNDVIANAGVLLAAGGVFLTHSKYPDFLVGGLISVLVLRSSYLVLKESFFALR